MKRFFAIAMVLARLLTQTDFGSYRQVFLIYGRPDGTGGFTECPTAHDPLPASYRPGWGLAVGDINRDGYPDIVAGFGSEGGGALRAWAQRPPDPTP